MSKLIDSDLASDILRILPNHLYSFMADLVTAPIHNDIKLSFKFPENLHLWPQEVMEKDWKKIIKGFEDQSQFCLYTLSKGGSFEILLNSISEILEKEFHNPKLVQKLVLSIRITFERYFEKELGATLWSFIRTHWDEILKEYDAICRDESPFYQLIDRLYSSLLLNYYQMTNSEES